MENVIGNTGINNGLDLSGSQSMSEIMYFYGTTIDGNRFTIAGLIEDDDLYLALALCGNGEQFSKAKGRTIAAGRILNQRKSPHGRIVRSLYALPADSQFATENGMFITDYFKGIEIKVFRDVVCEYNYCTKKELMDEFGLFKRTYVLIEK